jgi:zinc protease
MGPGLFNVTCSVRAGKDIKEAEAAMNAVLDAAPTALVTEQELQRVRASARRSDVSMRQSALNRAQSLADYAALYNDPNRINTLSARLSAVTAADVQRVARTYLRRRIAWSCITLPGAGTPPAPPHQSAERRTHMNRYLFAGTVRGLPAGPLAGILRLAEPALQAQDAPRAQQPTDFTGVQLKNRAPISNEVLKVKFPKPAESRLKNGMELLVLEEHRSPTIQVQIAVPASNLNDPRARPSARRPAT